MVLNRGKRGLPVDLKQAAGIEILRRLVRRSDVMLVAWQPGQAARLGLAYEDVREINPRLVYASITGWGPQGPDSGKLGYDYLVQAYSGIMASQPAADGTPTGTAFFPADMSIPMLLAYAIMVALWERERSGLGQLVETSQLQAQMAMQMIHLVFGGDRSLDAVDLGTSARRPPHTYQTADGRWLVLMPIPGAWPALLEALEVASEGSGPAGEIQDRDPAWVAALSERLAAHFAGRPRDEWLRRLAEAGLDSLCAPVQTRAELAASPQVAANAMMATQTHPVWGEVRMMAPPFSLSRSGWSTPPAAPHLGEHSEAVLEELGYDREQVEELRAEGVIK